MLRWPAPNRTLRTTRKVCVAIVLLGTIAVSAINWRTIVQAEARRFREGGPAAEQRLLWAEMQPIVAEVTAVANIQVNECGENLPQLEALFAHVYAEEAGVIEEYVDVTVSCTGNIISTTTTSSSTSTSSTVSTTSSSASTRSTVSSASSPSTTSSSSYAFVSTQSTHSSASTTSSSSTSTSSTVSMTSSSTSTSSTVSNTSTTVSTQSTQSSASTTTSSATSTSNTVSTTSSSTSSLSTVSSTSTSTQSAQSSASTTTSSSRATSSTVSATSSSTSTLSTVSSTSTSASSASTTSPSSHTTVTTQSTLSSASTTSLSSHTTVSTQSTQTTGAGGSSVCTDSNWCGTNALCTSFGGTVWIADYSGSFAINGVSYQQDNNDLCLGSESDLTEAECDSINGVFVLLTPDAYCLEKDPVTSRRLTDVQSEKPMKVIVDVTIQIPADASTNMTAYNVSAVSDIIGNETNESDPDDYLNNVAQVISLNVAKRLEALTADALANHVAAEAAAENITFTVLVESVVSPTLMVQTTSTSSSVSTGTTTSHRSSESSASTVSSLLSSTSSASSTTTAEESDPSTSSATSGAGVVVLIVILIFFILACLMGSFLLYRRRRGNSNSQAQPSDANGAGSQISKDLPTAWEGVA